MNNFTSFGLSSAFIEALDKMGINQPTKVQELTIPVAMQGRDILASAQTGSGKTIAFLLPLLEHIDSNSKDTALVLTPTREIADQVFNVLKKLLGNNKHKIQTALLIGGEPMGKQFSQLRNRPRIIIGTPGRVIDHLSRKSLRVDNTTFLVLDETDRMLDLGFNIQLQEIVPFLPEDRQTLMFSATLPKNIISLSKQYLTDPEIITAESENSEPPKIQQELIHSHYSKKFDNLMGELDKREGSIIIFVKTKRGADELADRINDTHHHNTARAIHGDLRQEKRKRIIESMRAQKLRIMVATDVAARGIDIPHIMHVINYDLPECPEDYVHRIGRTGRAGKEGFAVSMITSPDDEYKWQRIDRLMNPNKPREPRNENTGGSSKSRRSNGFGGRGARSGFGNGGGRNSRFGNDNRDRSDRKPFGNRGERSENENRSARAEDRRSDARPFGRSDRSEGDNRGRRSDSRPFGRRNGDDRPRGGFGNGGSSSRFGKARPKANKG